MYFYKYLHLEILGLEDIIRWDLRSRKLLENIFNRWKNVFLRIFASRNFRVRRYYSLRSSIWKFSINWKNVFLEIFAPRNFRFTRYYYWEINDFMWKVSKENFQSLRNVFFLFRNFYFDAVLRFSNILRILLPLIVQIQSLDIKICNRKKIIKNNIVVYIF